MVPTFGASEQQAFKEYHFNVFTFDSNFSLNRFKKSSHAMRGVLPLAADTKVTVLETNSFCSIILTSSHNCIMINYSRSTMNKSINTF